VIVLVMSGLVEELGGVVGSERTGSSLVGVGISQPTPPGPISKLNVDNSVEASLTIVMIVAV
jgi:hypothetical protein